jgi:hypothetical protein
MKTRDRLLCCQIQTSNMSSPLGSLCTWHEIVTVLKIIYTLDASSNHLFWFCIQIKYDNPSWFKCLFNWWTITTNASVVIEITCSSFSWWSISLFIITTTINKCTTNHFNNLLASLFLCISLVWFIKINFYFR